MSPSVTAVILNFDLTGETVACVRSLQRCSYASLRVLVVDNASPGGAEERLRRELPGVEVRATGRNLGYTGGINAGFRIAMEQPTDHLLVLNPTEVDPVSSTARRGHGGGSPGSHRGRNDLRVPRPHAGVVRGGRPVPGAASPCI
jgi:hypothetical protein